MIKANDLRIGNYVLRCNELGIWEEVILLSDMIVDCEMFPNLYKPIPLTIEVLVKCGFDWLGSFNEFKLHEFYLKHWQNYNSWKLIDRKGYDLFPPIPILEHLHQIQNLYFAMMGEELQVK